MIQFPSYPTFGPGGNGDWFRRDGMKSMLQTPAWAQLTAVRQGNTAILPKDLFHFKPNMRWAEAYAYLINLLSEAA